MSKSKYVNRDELVRYLWGIEFANPIAHNARNDVCDVIEQYEGADADVRENVHGEWVDAEDSELNYYYSVCSHCGSCLQIEKKYRNFCPNCGAIMDGGDV